MGDLNRDKDAAKTTKIIGSDIDGNETNFLAVNEEGEVQVSSFANISYLSTAKSVTTTEVLAAAGASNLSGRKKLIVYNRGPQDIFFGPTGVSETNGIPILKDEFASFDVGDNVNVYLVTKTGSSNVVIQEFS